MCLNSPNFYDRLQNIAVNMFNLENGFNEEMMQPLEMCKDCGQFSQKLIHGELCSQCYEQKVEEEVNHNFHLIIIPINFSFYLDL